jgi:hypothetical protein
VADRRQNVLQRKILVDRFSPGRPCFRLVVLQLPLAHEEIRKRGEIALIGQPSRHIPVELARSVDVMNQYHGGLLPVPIGLRDIGGELRVFAFDMLKIRGRWGAPADWPGDRFVTHRCRLLCIEPNSSIPR